MHANIRSAAIYSTVEGCRLLISRAAHLRLMRLRTQFVCQRIHSVWLGQHLLLFASPWSATEGALSCYRVVRSMTSPVSWHGHSLQSRGLFPLPPQRTRSAGMWELCLNELCIIHSHHGQSMAWPSSIY